MMLPLHKIVLAHVTLNGLVPQLKKIAYQEIESGRVIFFRPSNTYINIEYAEISLAQLFGLCDLAGGY